MERLSVFNCLTTPENYLTLKRFVGRSMLKVLESQGCSQGVNVSTLYWGPRQIASGVSIRGHIPCGCTEQSILRFHFLNSTPIEEVVAGNKCRMTFRIWEHEMQSESKCFASFDTFHASPFRRTILTFTNRRYASNITASSFSIHTTR
jgi:hypothetical protein